jgi:3-oxoacyl-[acyl-carrier protein] reductase
MFGDFMYHGKTMLLTGSSSGIAKEIYNYFTNLGMNVILTYHNNKINNGYYLDLKDEDSIIKLANDIENKYGKIDYLVNNASISLDNYLYDKTKEEFMDVLETNVVGTFLMMKHFDKIVNGFIFNISSTDGIDTGSIYSIDYNVSKAGINMLTKTFSLESKNKIISICPNWVDTNSTRGMNQDYLNSELKRIKQDKLISEKTIPKVIDNLIKEDVSSGSIIRIEGDDCVRRID